MSVLRPGNGVSEDILHGADREAALATCSCTTESLSSPAGEIMVLWVGGDVDLLTSPELEAALDSSLDQHPAHLVVGLARLRFCSARGMGLLIRAGVTAAERGIGYAVCDVPPLLDRVWGKLWDGELPVRYPSVAAAVTAIRARDAPWPE